MKHLLLVEDDASLGATLKERLEKEGYSVSWAQTLTDARRRFSEQAASLVILDVGLPDGSGFEFASALRSVSRIPFLFVTAQVSAEDRLQGYEIGAEEYIPKPFHLKEFLIRVKHVLESHASVPAPRAIRVFGRTIDLQAMSVAGPEGRAEYLAARDHQLLKLLIDSSPKVVSRDEILDRVWGEQNYPSSRTVDNAIVRLRQAIGDADGSVIRSVRGVGYQWIATGDE